MTTTEHPAFDLQSFFGISGDHYPDHGPKGRRAVCFASGSNRIPEIRGFSSVGVPPGLAADQLLLAGGRHTVAVAELERLAGTGIPVFLDSGAFSEFRSGVEITEDAWRQRLALYLHLAKVLEAQLYVVAPDRVGDQATTLERLQKFAPEIQDVAEYGAQILLPMQPGDLAMDEYQMAAQEILGVPVIPAFPMRDAMTSAERVKAFVQANMPPKIHLLGLGAANKKTQALIDGLWEIKPDLHISQDAMLLKARMGTAESPRQFDMSFEEAGAFCEAVHDDVDLWGGAWRYTDEIGDPTAWMPQALRRAIAGTMRMDQAESKVFMQDPTAYLNTEVEPGHTHWENAILDAQIEEAWSKTVAQGVALRRRAWAISQAFEDHPAAHQFAGGRAVFGPDIDPGPDAGACLAELRAICQENRLRTPKKPSAQVLRPAC